MKAYMSVESSFRSYCELGSTDEHGTPLETVAEREARRILADVELARPGQFAYGYGGDATIRAALAESLAAFVAE